MPRPLVPQRRTRIIDAADALLLARGWQQTTISDIAAEAGIGKGAVYLEFDDKSAVLDAVVLRHTRALVAQVRERVTSTTEPVGLAAVYRFGVEALVGDPLMSALYTRQGDVLGTHAATVTDGRYAERSDLLIEYTRQLQRAGVLDPAVPSADIVQMLSVFTIGMLNAPGVIDMAQSQLLTAVSLFGKVVDRGLAGRGPVDDDEAVDAQRVLLDRLDEQLRRLEDPR